MQEVISERQSLPLNEEEREHWLRDPHEEPEAEALFHNSREAMVINDFEETPEGIIETQTLITQHVIPEAASLIHEQEDVLAREASEPPEQPYQEDSSPEQLPEPQKFDNSSEVMERSTGLLLV